MTGVEYVRALCKKKGIPIAKLERDLGYGNGYLNPKKNTQIDFDRAREISEYLDCDIEDVYGRPVHVVGIDPGPSRTLNDAVYEEIAPGLSKVIKMYMLFDENDRNEILALMKAKLSKYLDEEKETPDEHKSAG